MKGVNSLKYIIDLDGTIMNGEKPNLDSVQFLNELEKRNIEFIIMTNSIRSPEAISKRLSCVGINLELEKIFNPISAINTYLANNNFKNAFIIGSSLEIEQVKIREDKENPEIIVLLDFEEENISFNTLQKVFELINKNIPVISASKSPYYIKNNKQILDTGSFVSLLECAGDIKIEILGKPSKAYFESGILRLNCQPSEVTVIGDDWSTDILGANSIGFHSVLLKSGKYKNGDEFNCLPDKCITYLMQIFE